MALGGIPYYLTYIKKGLSASENIQKILCDHSAPLKDEFTKLFYSLFSSAEAYIELMKLIGSKKEGVSRRELDKLTTLSQGGGRLTERLKQLKQTHFIEAYIPLKKEKSEYYKVVDEFCLFYLYWLQKNQSRRLVDNFWINQTQKPLYHVWAGYAFEAVCYKHIRQIINALNIPSAESISAWRSRPNPKEETVGTQIDLLIERSDDAITLCEIKYTEQPFILQKFYVDTLKAKIKTFRKITKTKKQLFLALISANGLKENAYSSEMIDATADLEDLFKA